MTKFVCTTSKLTTTRTEIQVTYMSSSGPQGKRFPLVDRKTGKLFPFTVIKDIKAQAYDFLKLKDQIIYDNAHKKLTEASLSRGNLSFTNSSMGIDIGIGGAFIGTEKTDDRYRFIFSWVSAKGFTQKRYIDRIGYLHFSELWSESMTEHCKANNISMPDNYRAYRPTRKEYIDYLGDLVNWVNERVERKYIVKANIILLEPKAKQGA